MASRFPCRSKAHSTLRDAAFPSLATARGAPPVSALQPGPSVLIATAMAVEEARAQKRSSPRSTPVTSSGVTTAVTRAAMAVALKDVVAMDLEADQATFLLVRSAT